MRAHRGGIIVAALLATGGCRGADDPLGSSRSSVTLNADVVIDSAIVLASGTTYDCGGHRILPRVTGRPDDSRTATVEYVPSVPEVAFLLHEVEDVKIENCVLGDDRLFDFGVFLLRARGNTIRDSELRARYISLQIIDADDNLVADNDIVYGMGARGTGVLAYLDADRNVIRGNRVVADSVNENTLVPLMPGGRDLRNRRPNGIAINNAVMNDGGLLTFRLGDLVVQLPNSETDADGLPLRLEDNVAEGNDVNTRVSVETRPSFGINGGSNVSRMVVRSNLVRQAGFGIQFSGLTHEDVRLPGGCAGDPGRHCLTAADCDGGGACDAPAPVVKLGAAPGSDGCVIRDNAIVGPTVLGMRLTGTATDLQVEGNVVSGASDAGLRLQDRGALETATLSRNVVTGNRWGLSLLMTAGATQPATAFASRVLRNDFSGNDRAIRPTGSCRVAAAQLCTTSADCVDNTCACDGAGCRCPVTGLECSANPAVCQSNACSNPYVLQTELSVGRHGNLWGRACDDSGGFRDFGEPGADSPSPLITDSHPDCL